MGGISVKVGNVDLQIEHMLHQEQEGISSTEVELYQYLRQLVSPETMAASAEPQFALVEAYWHIGRILVEVEQQGSVRADYGVYLIEQWSVRLSTEFGRGYSLPNMWRFKQFYLAFQILSSSRRELIDLRKHLRTELTWTHYRTLMSIVDIQERNFYEQQAANERWSVRFLQRMIRSNYYDHVMKRGNQLIPDNSKPKAQPKSVTAKDQSVPIESTRGRVAAIKKMLLNRYVGYAYVTQRQFISIEGQDYWIELIFFQYILDRFVLIHLGEHDEVTIATFQLGINAYISKQPPDHTSYPIGLLVNSQGRVHSVSTAQEGRLPVEIESILPISLV